MNHLAAWYESKDPGGALVLLAAVPEQTLFAVGDDLRVPESMPNIIGAAALENDASGVQAQVQSPSLRMLSNLDIEPIILAAVFGSPPEVLFHPENPIPVTAEEALNFAVLSDPAAAAAHYGLVWLADGPQLPIAGHVFSLRATATVQQVAGAWVNGNMTYTQTLPAGRYQVVGMRVRSTDLVAARLVFPEQIARPGVPAVNAIADIDVKTFRYGRSGIWGEFPHTTPPTLDVLGGTAAAQTVILDLLRV